MLAGKRALLLIVGLVAAVWPALVAAQGNLAGKIDAILADPATGRMHAGVCIAEVAGGKTLYSRAADELFVPASNMKLLATAAALDQLGAEFAFTTIFARRGDDLVVLASGDPGLGDERLADRRKQPIDAVFVRVAEALKKANVNRVAGDLVIDASVFDNEYFHPNWPADQRGEWYAAEVGGFNFNDNCIDIRLAPSAGSNPPLVELSPNTRYVQIVNKSVNDPKKHLVWFRREGVSNTITAGGKVQKRMFQAVSVPIHDPPAFAAQVLAETLARQGVPVAGKIRFERVRRADGTPPPGLAILCRHEQVIGEILWRCNTFSQNFMAEALFKSLGAYRGQSTTPSGVGSWATGRAAVLDFLKRQGIAAPAGLAVDDGSGLSKANQISPGLLARLLVKMAAHPANEMWFDSLATAGVDGTLRKRFRSLDAGEMVLAKTGTLASAVSLSGYVRTKAGREFAFSCMFDRLKGGDRWQARALMDKIVVALTAEK